MLTGAGTVQKLSPLLRRQHGDRNYKNIRDHRAINAYDYAVSR
jgi:hypothetical protein